MTNDLLKGININAHTVNIGGDVVGRDKVTAREAAAPDRGEAAFRVLVIISRPLDVSELPVIADQWQLIRGLAQVEASAYLKVLTPPTIEALRSELHNRYDVIHFDGHGSFDRAAKNGALYFEKTDGTYDKLPAADLVQMIHETGAATKLIALSACESAMGDGESLASTLVAGGLRAVIGMREVITAAEVLANYNAISVVPPPPWSTSYYVSADAMQNKYIFYKQGCDQANLGQGDVVVILDFGDPMIQNNVYGTYLPSSNYFVSLSDIAAASEKFMSGYWDCSESFPYAHLTLAIGTNNTRDVGQSHGKEWAIKMNDLAYWVSRLGCTNPAGSFPCSYNRRISVTAAIDIEDFCDKRDSQEVCKQKRLIRQPLTVQWAESYANNTYVRYFNYGTCEVCDLSATPPSLDLRHIPNEGHDFIWYVSWGIPNAYVIPEIYQRDSFNAYQWRNVSYYAATCTGNCKPAQLGRSGRIYFSGVLTQWQACRGKPSCDVDRIDNLPWIGWKQLYDALRVTNYTDQGNIGWSTDITWKLGRIEP